MSRSAKLALLLVLLIGAAAGDSSPGGPPCLADEDGLRVGAGGLQLYPRWNKLFTPLAEIEEGEALAVLAERGSWKHVRVESTGQEGWVFCEVRKEREDSAPMKLPIAATPATSGLVAKGWSAEVYAAKHGAGLDRVEQIMSRKLDLSRYQRFIEEGGLLR